MAEKDEINVVLTVDSSALDDLSATASDVPSSIDIEVNADTSGLDVSEITDLDGEVISPEIDTTESDDSKKVREGISFLATMKKIEVAINVIGTAIDFVKDIGNLTVAPFLEVDNAVAKINAQTGSGTGIADLGQFIRDIQGADLGTGVDQITNVVIAAKQLNAPIKEATTAALSFTKTFADQDPVTVLTTLNNLVETGLVPNLQDAADLMTVAFQQGVNKGGDALAVINSNAQSWKDMGLNGTQALSAINSLQDAGVDSATDAAKMIQTLDDALTTAAANAKSPQADALKNLGIKNPKDSGQAMGADFIDGFASAFTTLPSDQQDLVSGVLFGKGGKKFTGALAGLTTQGGPFSDITGAAADAATEIDNSLQGAIADFVTEINKQVGELLSSDAIDLPGKIAALKTGLQDALTVLQGGGTVGQALEIGLKVPGLEKTLDTFIGNFERIVGNIEIAFLQVVATIQDITGHGTEAAATRETIKGKATTQLAFDLQLANADELPAMVSQALSRGLSTSDVVTALETGVNESIAKANFDQGATIIQGAISGAIADGATPEAANALAFGFTDKLKGAFDNALAVGDLPKLQDLIAIEPNAKVPGLDDAVAGFQKQLSDAFAPKAGNGAPSMFGSMANPFQSLPGQFSPANNPFSPANLSAMGLGGVGGKGGATSQNNSLLGDLTKQATDLAATMTDSDNVIGGVVSHITTNTGAVADAATTDMATVGTAFDTAAVNAALMDQNINLSLVGHSVTDTFQTVADAATSAFPIVLEWFGRTAQGAQEMDMKASSAIQDLSNKLHDLQFLSAAVAQGVKDTLQVGANLPGAGGGGNSTNTNNTTVNQTNNNQNGAQTAASTYQIAAAIGGA